MIKHTEVMKQALEALKSCDAAHITDGGRQWYDEKLVDKAVEAIEKALASEAKEQPAQQQQEPEYKGWYCAHCQRGVDSSEVTYHEQHTVCGRVITDDLPPMTQQQEPVAKVDYKQRDGFRWLNYLGWQRIPDGASLYTSPPASIHKEPSQQTCNCRWEGETQVQQCTLHEAHVDAIHEWAERAKIAEAVLEKLLNEREKQKPEVWMDANDDVFFTEADAYKTGITPIRGLYTSPPPQRKPLTDEQREEIAKGWRGRNWTVGDIIDATEAAHGIKE